MFQYIDAQGRIVVRDPTAPGQPIILDTKDGNLTVDPADYFTGSVSLPSRSATSSGVDGFQGTLDITAEYFIGTPASPSANILMGNLKRSTAFGWRSAHGTHILDQDAVGLTMKPQTDLIGQEFLATQRAVTPLINPLGHVVLRERTIIRPRDPGSPPSITKTLPAVTVDYRLFCGSWWGQTYEEPRADADFRTSATPGVPTINFTNVEAGYSYQGRRLVVVIQNARGTTNPSSVTIGGVAATIHGTVASTNTRTTIASALVPTGTQVDVTVVNASASQFVGFSLYAVRPVTGATPVIYSTTQASNTQATLAIPQTGNACAIVLSTMRGGASASCSWTGAAEVVDRVLPFTPNGSFSGAIMDTIPGGNVTAAWTGGAGEISMLAAVFS